MIPKLLPEDLCIEDLLMYLPEDSYRIALRGTHKRNAYQDIMHLEEKDGRLDIQVGRNSLYNSMPEYLFHPINRFENIPDSERQERFQEEHYKQEKEKEDAFAFFAPTDNLLLSVKAEVKNKLRQYTSENTVMQNIIGDRMNARQRSNPFIRRCLPFLPKCKWIRGNKTLLTLMLKKILREEDMLVQLHPCCHTLNDSEPRYKENIDSQLNDIFIGDGFEETITTYDVHFWSEENCDRNFHKFLEDIEEFRQFIQDYFISVEEIIRFNIVKDESPLVLSDETTYNYLNFNTNI